MATSIMFGGSAAADPAPPSDISVTSLHRTWSCSVPAGYTWSQIRSNSSCASRYQYYLLDGVNYNLTGMWACYPPQGYTFTQSRVGNNCAVSPGQSPYEYLLARI